MLAIQNGEQGGRKGHCVLQVYVDGNWILANSNSGQYIVDHDVHNPAIPIAKPQAEQTGYVVYQKGKDLWNMGVTDISQNRETMREYALNNDLDAIEFPDVEVLEFERR